MKINVPYINHDGSCLLEVLEFKELNEGIFSLTEKPKYCHLKVGEIYYITLGAPIATKIESMAEFVKNTLSREEVQELMDRLSE